MVTKGTFAYSVRWKHDEKKEDDEVSDEARDIRNGETVCGLVEEVYLFVTASFKGKKGDSADPGHPDDPFDVVTPVNLTVLCQEECLLASCCGTHPTTISSSQE